MADIEEVAEIKRTSENSYQLLIEGKAELLIQPRDDDENECNFSKLLRDLYKKLYILEGKVASLSNK
jgi:hypothetical protein